MASMTAPVACKTSPHRLKYTLMVRTLLLILLIGSVATFALAACSKKPEKLVAESEFEKPVKKADVPLAGFGQELQSVRYAHSKDDKLQWELIAKFVEQVEDGSANLEEVKITYYSDDGTITVLTADKGLYESATQNAMVHGNVIVTRSDGDRVNTDTLRWNQQEERLEGEGNVTITRRSTVIKGKGFELTPSRETFRILNVEGVIHKGDIEQ